MNSVQTYINNGGSTKGLTGFKAVAINSTSPYYLVSTSDPKKNVKAKNVFYKGSELGIIQLVSLIQGRYYVKVSLFTPIKMTYPTTFGTGTLEKAQNMWFDIADMGYLENYTASGKTTLYAKTSGSKLTLRQAASTTSAKIGEFANGEIIGTTDGKITNPQIISGQTVGWYQVTTPSGIVGYVRQDFTTTIKPSGLPLPKPAEVGKDTTAETKIQEEAVGTFFQRYANYFLYGGIAIIITLVVGTFFKPKKILQINGTATSK